MQIDFEAGFRFRADDGLFIANCGAFIYWRYAGEREWRRDELRLEWRGQRAVGRAHGFELRAEWTRAADDAYVRRGTLSYSGARSVEVARLNDLEGDVAPRAALYAMTPLSNGACRAAQGERLPPRRSYDEALWASMHVYWPRLAEPISDMPDVASTDDIGLLAMASGAPGLALCYTGPGRSMGEVGLFTRSGRFYAGMPLDGVRMDDGDCRELERLALLNMTMSGALNWWARRCACEAGAVCRLLSFAGYCSWYHDANRIMPDTVRRAARGLARWPHDRDSCTVQIDDGFQKMPGDWRGNVDWAEALSAMPAELEAQGLMPGLWLAPHAVSERHPLYREHPEYFQRLPDGRPAISFSNWGWTEADRATWRFSNTPGGQTYFLDPDVPEAREFMRELLRAKRAEGWRYFKLDFTYALSNARVKRDPKKAGFETLRDMWRLFREALGDDAVINACIGANYRWALGSADMARIGGDMGSDPRQLADSVRRMAQNVCTNGKWWLVDPDVFYMSAVHSRGGEELNYLLAGTARLMGGVFMTSDLPEWWSERECELLRPLWPGAEAQPPVRHVLATSEDGLPQTLLARFDGYALLGVYNWSDAERGRTIDAAEAGLEPGERLEPIRADCVPPGAADGVLTLTAQPPLSLRMFKVVPR